MLKHFIGSINEQIVKINIRRVLLQIRKRDLLEILRRAPEANYRTNASHLVTCLPSYDVFQIHFPENGFRVWNWGGHHPNRKNTQLNKMFINVVIVGDARVGKTRFKDMVRVDHHCVFKNHKVIRLDLNDFVSKPYVPSCPPNSVNQVGGFLDADGNRRELIFTEISNSDISRKYQSAYFNLADVFIVIHKGDPDKWISKIRETQPDKPILALNINKIRSRRDAYDWMESHFGKNVSQDEDTMTRTYADLCKEACA